MSTKISQLTAATTPTGPESVPIVQSGNTRKATITQVVTTPVPTLTATVSVITPIVDSNSGSLVLKGATTTAQTITGANTVLSGTLTPTQTGGIVGTTTNNSAQTGSVGEYIESIIASGSAVSLSTGTAKTVTSVSLTAGDWDISGEVSILGGATTNITEFLFGSSPTTNTIGSQGSFGIQVYGVAGLVPFGINGIEIPIPTFRYLLSTTSSVFLIARVIFTVSTCTAYGAIRARRIR